MITNNVITNNVIRIGTNVITNFCDNFVTYFRHSLPKTYTITTNSYSHTCIIYLNIDYVHITQINSTILIFIHITVYVSYMKISVHDLSNIFI